MPLIQKFNEYFDTNLKPSKGIYVEKLDAHTRALVEKYFLSLGFPALHGLYNIFYNHRHVNGNDHSDHGQSCEISR